MEPLKDPLNDRKAKNVKPPPQKNLDTEKLFPSGTVSNSILAKPDKPDWKLLRNHLHREGQLHKSDILKLVEAVNKILSIFDW